MRLFQGDCLEIMPRLDPKSVDMVLCDLPYGRTRNKWDTQIPLDKLWAEFERIVKDNGVIVLFAQTPFDKQLGSSNSKMLKYEWIWVKKQGSGHLNAKKMPLKRHENILVFYKNLPKYNPQMTEGVTEGYKKTLKVNGVGWKVAKQGNKVVMNIGFSHPVDFPEPAGVKLECPSVNEIVVSGIDKTLVGQTAANIRKLRVPEPYHGYGIAYKDEVIERKEGKTGGKAEEFRSAETDLTVYPSQDWTKLLIDFKPLGISPDKVLSLLEKKGVYAEFSDGRYILFYLSPMTEAGDLNTLKKKLTSVLSVRKLKGSYVEKPAFPVGDRSYSFQYALRKQTEWVELDDAVGRMCAKNAGLYPPCVPVIVTGEMITLAAVKTLSQAKSTFGVQDGKICVVKKW